jgi:hypothetical protein
MRNMEQVLNFSESAEKKSLTFFPLVRELSAKRRTTVGGLAQGGG